MLRDEVLGLEVPLWVAADVELSFQPEDGQRLNVEQWCDIAAQIQQQDDHAPIEVTETFGVLRQYLSDMMLRPAGEGDEEHARRLGRVIAVASLFDSGVDYLMEYWTTVTTAAQRGRGRAEESGSTSSPASTGSPNLAQAVVELLDLSVHVLLRRLDSIEEHSSHSALQARLILNLSQASWLLNISDTTLRTSGWLNDLSEAPHDEHKLNGHRSGSSSRAAWRFHREEVERFG